MEDLNRRGLIVSGAAAVAAAGLAACSTPTSPSPAASAPANTAGGAAPSSGGAVTVKTADVPVGGGTILQNAKYVVTQPTAGTYKAFNKTCTHQGCPVSKIVGAEIVCTCHNSKFSITDGAVTAAPATKPLAAAKVTVQGDSLLITD